MKAFPRADGKFNSAISDEQGMDLRDWFAGMAMQGLVIKWASEDETEEDVALTCSAAYTYADWLMKQRENNHE